MSDMQEFREWCEQNGGKVSTHPAGERFICESGGDEVVFVDDGREKALSGGHVDLRGVQDVEYTGGTKLRAENAAHEVEFTFVGDGISGYVYEGEY